MNGNVKVIGLNKVINNLLKVQKDIEKGKRFGLKLAGETVLRESQTRYVPVDSGFLKNSAYNNPIHDGVEIGYSASYALWVHENLEAKHGKDYNAAYGKKGEKLRGEEQCAKFLEKALNEKKNEAMKIVAETIKAYAGGL